MASLLYALILIALIVLGGVFALMLVDAIMGHAHVFASIAHVAIIAALMLFTARTIAIDATLRIAMLIGYGLTGLKACAVFARYF